MLIIIWQLVGFVVGLLFDWKRCFFLVWRVFDAAVCSFAGVESDWGMNMRDFIRSFQSERSPLRVLSVAYKKNREQHRLSKPNRKFQESPASGPRLSDEDFDEWMVHVHRLESYVPCSPVAVDRWKLCCISWQRLSDEIWTKAGPTVAHNNCETMVRLVGWSTVHYVKMKWVSQYPITYLLASTSIHIL